MVSTEQLETLLFSQQQLEQRWVLGLHARPETWRFIYDRYPQLAFVLAQNPSLPTDLADELANHPEARVRLMIARHRSLSDFGVQTLIDDPEAAVRLALARRKDLDPCFTEQLQMDADVGVRLATERYQQHQPLAMASGW